MAKSNEPKLNNCKPNDVFSLIEKLGDFEIKEGAKHTKIIHIATGQATMIPRCHKINRFLLKSVVEKYLISTLKYEREEIFKHLTC